MFETMVATTFFVLCGFATYTDVARYKIPNWINVYLVLLFIPAAFLTQIGWATAGWHFLLAFGVLVFTYTMFSFNLIGGGDAKLIPAVLLWIGPAGGIHFVYGMALTGGILALVLLLLRKQVPAELAPRFAQPLIAEKKDIPYGVAIFGGAVYASALSPLLASFVGQFGHVL